LDEGPRGIAASDAQLDRLAAARDLWPGGTIEMWAGRPGPTPERIFWPEDAAQVEAVLGWASPRGIPVVPYGAGSGVCGGAAGRAGTVVLDTKRLDRIGPLDATRWTVEVEAGVNGQHLEDWLNARGFTLGHSPSSIWCSTVGGWAAARSAGQFSSRYGVFEDMLLAVEAVAPGRGRFRVGEGGDAPDGWLPLLLGSEGTLAVITRMTLRVWPVPATRWLRGYRFAHLADAVSAMRRLMQAELWPAVLRLYDPVDTRIGGRTKAKRAGGERARVRRWLARGADHAAVKGRSLALPLALPGLVNRVFDRAAGGVMLVVGWEGDPEVVAAASEAGRAILGENGEDLGAEPGERWLHARHHVSYKLMPIFERGGFADTMEVAVHWSALEPLYHAVRAAVSPHVVVMAHMSHLYPEGGSIYFSFAGRGDRAVYDRTWRAALAAVLAAGATVTHHHGVGILKAEAVTREIGPAVEAWRSLKAVLDPAGVLNPGRVYVPGVAVPGPEADTPPLTAEDGLVRLALPLAEVPAGALAWPWESLPPPPRWLRSWWQSGPVEVAGSLDGVAVRLGRGPRSASGPDPREWFLPAARTVTLAAAPSGTRWMGEGKPENPWMVAQALLRGDLRPAVLTVEKGVLRVGFRGPAAAAFGALAAARVPGGLAEVPFRQAPLPSGALVPCRPTHRGEVADTAPAAEYRETRGNHVR
jgi:alkyldihydroxyacetonephosphate synthase